MAKFKVGQKMELTLFGFPEIVRVVKVDKAGSRIKVRCDDGAEEWVDF